MTGSTERWSGSRLTVLSRLRTVHRLSFGCFQNPWVGEKDESEGPETTLVYGTESNVLFSNPSSILILGV